MLRPCWLPSKEWPKTAKMSCKTQGILSHVGTAKMCSSHGGPVFSRSPLLKATDAIYIYIYCIFFFRDIPPLCVGATPVPKGFHHMSNF